MKLVTLTPIAEPHWLDGCSVRECDKTATHVASLHGASHCNYCGTSMLLCGDHAHQFHIDTKEIAL